MQKPAGREWYLHLKKKLDKTGFKPSSSDECVFYYGKTIFIVYTDDIIIMGLDKEEVVQTRKKWSNSERKYKRSSRLKIKVSSLIT
jgi:hypothetical protein